jgi:hypothetical protein
MDLKSNFSPLLCWALLAKTNLPYLVSTVNDRRFLVKVIGRYNAQFKNINRAAAQKLLNMIAATDQLSLSIY